MKKKILMLISVFVVGLVGMVTNGRTIYAQETSGLEQEYSYLLTEDAIVPPGKKGMESSIPFLFEL